MEFTTADKLQREADKSPLEEHKELLEMISKRQLNDAFRKIRDILLARGLYISRIKEMVANDNRIVVYSEHLRIDMLPGNEDWVITIYELK